MFFGQTAHMQYLGGPLEGRGPQVGNPAIENNLNLLLSLDSKLISVRIHFVIYDH